MLARKGVIAATAHSSAAAPRPDLRALSAELATAAVPGAALLPEAETCKHCLGVKGSTAAGRRFSRATRTASAQAARAKPDRGIGNGRPAAARTSTARAALGREVAHRNFAKAGSRSTMAAPSRAPAAGIVRRCHGAGAAGSLLRRDGTLPVGQGNPLSRPALTADGPAPRGRGARPAARPSCPDSHCFHPHEWRVRFAECGDHQRDCPASLGGRGVTPSSLTCEDPVPCLQT